MFGMNNSLVPMMWQCSAREMAKINSINTVTCHDGKEFYIYRMRIYMLDSIQYYKNIRACW